MAGSGTFEALMDKIYFIVTGTRSVGKLPYICTGICIHLQIEE